jgi:hypothetical protein
MNMNVRDCATAQWKYIVATLDEAIRLHQKHRNDVNRIRVSLLKMARQDANANLLFARVHINPCQHHSKEEALLAFIQKRLDLCAELDNPNVRTIAQAELIRLSETVRQAQAIPA